LLIHQRLAAHHRPIDGNALTSGHDHDVTHPEGGHARGPRRLTSTRATVASGGATTSRSERRAVTTVAPRSTLRRREATRGAPPRGNAGAPPAAARSRPRDVAVQTAPTERGARAQQRRQPDGEYEAGGQRGRRGRQATASAEVAPMTFSSASSSRRGWTAGRRAALPAAAGQVRVQVFQLVDECLLDEAERVVVDPKLR